MRLYKTPTLVLMLLGLGLGLEPGLAHASNGKEPIRFDASMPRERQIQLAMSAAPEEVARRATIYVLGANGYEKAREGTNGFTCVVLRPYLIDLAPHCFDAEGTATVLRPSLHAEDLRAQGKSEAEVAADREEGYRSGRYIAPRKPGIVYMMSSENWLFVPDEKKISHVPAHLMFYAPYMTAKDLGYETEAKLPFLVLPGGPEALMIVVPAKHEGHSS